MMLLGRARKGSSLQFLGVIQRFPVERSAVRSIGTGWNSSRYQLAEVAKCCMRGADVVFDATEAVSNATRPRVSSGKLAHFQFRLVSRSISCDATSWCNVRPPPRGGGVPPPSPPKKIGTRTFSVFFDVGGGGTTLT